MKLFEICEDSKVIMGTFHSNRKIEIRDFLTLQTGDIMAFHSTIKYRFFEQFFIKNKNRFVDPIHTALKNANISRKSIDDVILIGGSSRIPLINELILAKIRKEPFKRVQPEEAIAKGCSIYGALKSGLVKNINGYTSINIIDKNSYPFKLFDQILIPAYSNLPYESGWIPFKNKLNSIQTIEIPIYEGDSILNKVPIEFPENSTRIFLKLFLNKENELSLYSSQSDQNSINSPNVIKIDAFRFESHRSNDEIIQIQEQVGRLIYDEIVEEHFLYHRVVIDFLEKLDNEISREIIGPEQKIFKNFINKKEKEINSKYNDSKTITKLECISFIQEAETFAAEVYPEYTRTQSLQQILKKAFISI